MKKMKWKLHRDQVSGLGLLLNEYIECLEPKNIQDKWVLLEIRMLHHRLWVKGQMMAMEKRTRAAVTIPMRECYAFATLMCLHPGSPTNYIDVLVLQMVNDINQTSL